MACALPNLRSAEKSRRPRPFNMTATKSLQVRVPVKAGLRQVMATMLKSDDAEPEGGGRRPPFAVQPQF